jgi:hypothetical protein
MFLCHSWSGKRQPRHRMTSSSIGQIAIQYSTVHRRVCSGFPGTRQGRISTPYVLRCPNRFTNITLASRSVKPWCRPMQHQCTTGAAPVHDQRRPRFLTLPPTASNTPSVQASGTQCTRVPDLASRPPETHQNTPAGGQCSPVQSSAPPVHPCGPRRAHCSS